MPKGKTFNDFTYGVGLEVNATSFKQVKDDLKLNLDNLAKMVKSYGKILKVNPDADLSVLFTEMGKLKSIVDGIGASDNSFAGFVDKGVLERIATLENRLNAVSNTSEVAASNISGLASDIKSATENLKAAGAVKLPGTFGNLFDSVTDQSEQIKQVKDQIVQIQKLAKQIKAVKDKINNVDGFDFSANSGISDIQFKEYKDVLDKFYALTTKLTNANPTEMVGLMQQYRNMANQISQTIRMMSDEQTETLYFDFDLYNKQVKQVEKSIAKEYLKLDDKLKELKAGQEKYNQAVSAAVPSGKSLGVQSDYTAQVALSPKINDAEWKNKINTTIGNLGSFQVQVVPTVFKTSYSTKKSIEGQLSKITHQITANLQVQDNLDDFTKKVQSINNAIRNAKAQLEQNAKFKISFAYDDEQNFKKVVYDTIDKFKKINSTLYITNGNKFLDNINSWKKKAADSLQNIPANIVVGNQDAVLSNIDNLRTEIDNKIRNIGVNLNIQNVPQFMAQSAMVKDELEKYYKDVAVGTVSNPGAISQASANSTNDMLALSEKAKEAQAQIQTIKNTIKSLNDMGFKSPDFFKLGSFDENSKYIKGSKAQLKQLLQAYDELYSKVHASKEELRSVYGANDAGYAAYQKDIDLLRQLEDVLNSVLQSQIQYAQKRMGVLDKTLKKELEISTARSNKGSSTETDKLDDKSVQQLGISAEEAKKKIQSLNGTLTQQKKVLEDLEQNGIKSKSLARLGEWDKSTSAFKKNAKEIQELINRYNELRQARIDNGGANKPAVGEEASIRGKLVAILKEQKKHVREIIAQNQTELDSVKQVYAAYKQTKTTKPQSAKTVSSDNSSRIDSKTESSTVNAKLDGATLNALAKNETLKNIDVKIGNILTQLTQGVVINGASVNINANNVSVVGGAQAGQSASGSTANVNVQSDGVDSAALSATQAIDVVKSKTTEIVDEVTGKTKKIVDVYRSADKVLETVQTSAWVSHGKDEPKTFEHVSTSRTVNTEAFNNMYNKFVKSLALQQQLEHQIVNANGPTDRLQAELSVRKEITDTLESQLKLYPDLYTAEKQQAAVVEAVKKSQQEIAKITGAQNDKNINQQNNSIARIVDNLQSRYDKMQYTAANFKVPMSDAAISKLKEYGSLLTTVKNKQQEIDDNPALMSDENYAKTFSELLLKLQEVDEKFVQLQRSSEDFLSKIKNPDDIMSLDAAFDATNLSQLQNEMQAFANQTGMGVAKLIEFNQVNQTATYEIQDGQGQLHRLTVAYDQATNSLGRYVNKTKESMSESQKFFKSLKHSFQNVARYVASFGSIYKLFSIIRTGLTYIKEIDSALIELKKVTDETDEAYGKFLQNMSKTASIVGSTVADLTTMAAEWARLGYTMEEAGKLAKSTAILLNVSEFKDATSASEALISTMQAFQYTADESQHVVDILNEVGNNYAVSSDGIATALKDSASALMEGGNNLEQATALVAAANKVVQDPNSVGSALRTISLRLRGTSVEILEEMGEATDGAVESTSKLQAKLKALTGVNILNDAGTYKDTYTILKEIGTVWSDLDPMDQAAALELMAGKNRANTLAAILNNMTDLEGAYETAMNAEGSALRENEVYLDSIQGRIDILTNSFQTMWMNFLDSKVIKFVVDVANALVKLTDNVGLVQSAFTLLGGVFVKKKWGDLFFPSKETVQEKAQELQKAMEQAQENFNNNPNTKNRKEKENAEKNYAAYQDSLKSSVPELEKQVKAETKLNNTLLERQRLEVELKDAQAERAYAWSIEDEAALSAADERVQKTQAEIDALDGIAEAANDVTDSVVVMGNEGQVAGDKVAKGAKKGENGFKSLAAAAKQYLFSMAAMYAISTAIELVYAGISRLVTMFDESVQSAEELHDEYIEASDALSSCTSEVSSLESELKTTNDKIEELMSQGTLSFVEQEELERLQSVSAELERQLNITKTLQDSLQTGTSAAAMNAANAYLDTSFGSKESKTERQEAAKEEGSTFGKYAGLIIGGILTAGAIALTVATGGAGAAAIPAALSSSAGWIGVGAMAGSMVGEGVGGVYKSSKAGKVYDQEQTVSAAITSMNKTRDELIKARDEAYEAYAADPGNDKFKEEYSKAADDLATYDETMATRITQLSQYYNSIMQGWENAEPEVQETARQLGDMIDAYNIEMGGANAKSNAIDRIFGEEADTKLQNVKTKLEEMAAAGDKVDLKKAFGGDTAAYDAFVQRLYEMGIYVYECEDAFVELAQAEAAAAAVSFSDIATDIQKIESAITGVKGAFTEFLEGGIVSSSTIVDLEEDLGIATATEDLKTAYEEYISVMLAGNSSVAEAKAATSELAQAYLSDQLNMSDITEEQIQAYVAQLKELGIENASEFVTKKLQQTGIKQIKSAMSRDSDLTSVSQEIKDIIDQYSLEQQTVDSLIESLKEKNELENNRDKAQNKQDAYQTFLNEDGGYNQAKQAVEMAEKKLKDAEKTAAYWKEFLENNPEDWTSTVSGTELNPVVAYTSKTNPNISITSDEYIAISDAVEQAKTELADAEQQFKVKVSEGIRDGYLAGDGSLSEDAAKRIQDEVDATQKAVDKINTEIDLEYTIDYELEFATPDMINTISGITAALEQYKSVMDMVNEVAYNGQVISEEYYNALREQIGEVTVGTEDFFDAIDASNGYVVKNADLLKKLAEQSKKLQQKNVALAKSQARLEYYNLVKKMSKCIDISKSLSNEDVKQIKLLATEANALQKVINRYSMLELQLLGVSDAYDAFAKAQEADAEVDYISTVEDAVLGLGEAFNTAKLGTETAQAAINMIIPKDIYEGIEALDTAKEKMDAIYDYYKNGKIAQYFDLEFDEDGNITSATAKLGNIRKFIEDGISGDYNKDGINIFQGTWEDFEYTEEFINNLANQEDKLGYFAEQMGVTKEVAFALIKAAEDLDIGHLDGSLGSLFDILVPQTLENDIYNVTQAISNLNQQLADGEIDAKEYAKQMYGIQGAFDQGIITEDEYNTEISKWNKKKASGQITETSYHEAVYGAEGAEDKLYEQAQEQVSIWLSKQQELESYQEKLAEYEQQIQGLTLNDDASQFLDENGKTVDIGIDVETFTENYQDVSSKISTLKNEISEIEEPTEVVFTFTLDQTRERMSDIESAVGDLIENIDYKWDASLEKYVITPKWNTDSEDYNQIVEFVDLLNQEHSIDLALGEDAKTVEDTISDVAATLSDIANILKTGFEFIIDDNGRIAEFKRRLDEATQDRTTKVTVTYDSDDPSTWSDWKKSHNYAQYASGTAHASGSAYAGGNWGAPKTETALTGELGPELLVRGNRWSLVGENGAEFTQVKKNDIIFNHKQTEEILKYGRITSRGKAYASGTTKTSGAAYAFTAGYTGADVKIYADGSSSSQWKGTGYNGPDDETYNLEEALNNAADAASEFEEALDWIEIRLEEWDEVISKLNSELENMTNYAEKNAKIDQIISKSYGKQADLQAGADYYEQYAQQYLNQLSGDYRTYAQNGAIAISDFAGEADEATVEAINKYREYAQKAADLRQQEEEITTEIRNLAIQQIDNAQHSGEVRATVEASQTEKLQNAVDFDEVRGMLTDPQYYAAMMENAERTMKYLSDARNAMQREFNDAVADGQLIVGSDEWYENIDKLYQMDAQIDEARNSIEEFQNAINDIYWESFDQIISQFDNLSDEAQGLVDILSSEDLFIEPDNEKGWSERDVQWTNEGLATLGLHAQEMERAEAKAQAYATAIDDLTREYKAGHYSESEYNEKLAELTKGQMDAIKAAKAEKDAIVELNKARIDAVKRGIEKEVEAYEELIKKKKESLDAEKDIYDFQKSVQEHQKEISSIERKIAALSSDNSASAIAQRKKLEAELAEAKANLQETYYERSIENQQTALDNELETFQEAKDKEIEAWDKYLDDVEIVITDSFNIIKSNIEPILGTLSATIQEYDLNSTLSDAILNPWTDGHSAIDDYTKKFGDSVSTTTAALDVVKNKWADVKSSIAAANKEADIYMSRAATIDSGNQSVASINAENAAYYAGQGVSNGSASKPTTQSASTTKTSSTPAVGSTVTVNSSATNFGSKSGSAAMASFVRGGSYTVYQVADGQALVGRNGVYTGWVKLSDLKGYAKGTKNLTKSGLVNVDELGEELILGARNGRLTYLEKGSGVIPADITSNLMAWGELNPQDMLDRSRPSMGIHPEVHHTEIQIDNSIGELIHIDNCDQSTLPDVEKIVNKALNKHMQTLNNNLKRYTR